MKKFTRWLRATLIMLLAGKTPTYININFPTWNTPTRLTIKRNGPSHFLCCGFEEAPPPEGVITDGE